MLRRCCPSTSGQAHRTGYKALARTSPARSGLQYLVDQKFTAGSAVWSSASRTEAVVHAESVDMNDWPCKLPALEAAREFVQRVASQGGKVLLAPDRDADGLCAGKSPRSTCM